VRVVRAPGRVNLIGDHTDYTGGLVLPAAIDLGITIRLEPTDDRRVELTLAEDGQRVVFDLDRLPERAGDWRDYVVGTAWAMIEAGAKVRGFRGLLTSDLPAGAGLSSSASLELVTAWALAGGESPLPDRMAVARAAQRAENEFVGVPCGLMDQFAVAFGVEGAALLLDCRSLEHRTVPLPPCALVVADSGVPRRLLGSAYEERREQCEEAVRILSGRDPRVRSLRDVDVDGLEEARSDGALPETVFRRARHVVTENARVAAAAAALEAGDLGGAGAHFLASHASLRDDFEVSIPELDRLVEVAAATPGVHGARLTGAGMGGSVIVLADPGAGPAVEAALVAGYRTPAGAPPVVREVSASAGARRLE
jgi:galactokinase